MFRWVATQGRDGAGGAIVAGAPAGRRGLSAAGLVVAAIALAACGQDPVPPAAQDGAATTDSAAVPDGDAGTTGKDGAAPGDGVGGDGSVQVPVTEEFWAVYNRRSKVVGASGIFENDLVLASWLNPDIGTNSSLSLGASPFDLTKPALELTKYSLKGTGMTCTYGCKVSHDLKFMAIAQGPPGASGFTWRPGVLNPKLEVFVNKFADLEKVAHLQFANGYLFYSTPANCLATGKCQYDLHRMDLNEGGAGSNVILTRMAPDADHDVTDNDTTYNGYFQVSENASTVVFLTPTIRSVKVYAWRGGNVSLLDYLCDHPVGDSCVGTGSQYHDDDKAGVSADGKTVVLFTIVDRWLKARKYHVGSEEAPEFSNLVEVPSGGAYLQTVCPVIKSKPWLHGEIRGQPYFSADGKDVYVLGYSKCGTNADKPWTDIMVLPLAKIGGTIAQGDWRILTKNPRDNSTKNKRIFDFTVSPLKQVFVISATASVEQSGKPIPDGQKRAMDDPELYTMNVGGAMAGQPVWVPITNEVKYAAEAPQTVLTVPPP